MSELKPCPFCGSKNAAVIRGENRDTGKPFWKVYCTWCQVRTDEKTRRYVAISAWNLRPLLRGDAK